MQYLYMLVYIRCQQRGGGGPNRFQRALVEATQDGVKTEIVFLLRLKSLQTLFSVRNMKETVSS